MKTATAPTRHTARQHNISRDRRAGRGQHRQPSRLRKPAKTVAIPMHRVVIVDRRGNEELREVTTNWAAALFAAMTINEELNGAASNHNVNEFGDDDRLAIVLPWKEDGLPA